MLGEPALVNLAAAFTRYQQRRSSCEFAQRRMGRGTPRLASAGRTSGARRARPRTASGQDGAGEPRLEPNVNVVVPRAYGSDSSDQLVCVSPRAAGQTPPCGLSAEVPTRLRHTVAVSEGTSAKRRRSPRHGACRAAGRLSQPASPELSDVPSADFSSARPPRLLCRLAPSDTRADTAPTAADHGAEQPTHAALSRRSPCSRGVVDTQTQRARRVSRRI